MSNGKLIVGTTGGQIDFSTTASVQTPAAGYVTLYGESSGGVTTLKTIDSNGNVNVYGSSGTSGVSGTSGTSGVDGAGGATGYYLNVYDTTDQLNAGATAYNLITYNTVDIANGWTVSSGSRLVQPSLGTFNIQFSAQFQKSSGGEDDVEIWLRKNGNDVPDTNTRITLTGNPSYEVAAWNFLVSGIAGDYWELAWSSADTTMELHHAPAGTNPTRPAIPSVILSVTPVIFAENGTSGSSGSSGTSGQNGTSGTSGQNGSSGTSGISGSSGTSGNSGSSGTSGQNGSSGTSGQNGSSGTSGISQPGTPGTSGTSGVSGSSGTSGNSGSSGTSGQDGSSGTSGQSGSSGTSGISQPGTPGTSGTSGISGSSGTSGNSGSSGTSGQDGSSGTSGQSGTSGTSGQDGAAGTSGTSGISGTPSPISVQNSSTIVSDAIGASAGNNTCSIVLGYNASVCDNTQRSIVIGTNVISKLSGCNFIGIGCFQPSQNPNYTVLVSPQAIHAAQYSINIGYNNNNNDGCQVIQLGTNNSVNVARDTIAIGHSNTFTGGFPGNQKMLAVGMTNCIKEYCAQGYGFGNLLECGATGSVALGNSNTLNHASAIVIGNGITSSYANTVHVDNVFALGQGASNWHANGNVTGTATIDFANGNNQGLSLTGSTTLTFSNPLPGANYTLAITQAGSGSYTITWPTIKWTGATPPTLSTAIGATDLISLTYDGTSYWGTYAFNFA